MQRNVHILVTGGLGYIGSHTVLALIERGYQPIILDNLNNSERYILDRLEQLSQQKIPFYQIDCTEKNPLEEIFGQHSLKGIIHFAAHKAVGESFHKPLAYYHNNLLSLLNILELSGQYGVEHFVFSSSCTVYGQAQKLPVDENTTILPASSAYGNTKQIGEEIIRDLYLSGARLKAMSLRYFNPVGAHPSALIGELPKGTPNNLVPFITQTAMGIRQELQVFGNDYPTPDGTCIRDYIHVCDLAEAHLQALEFLLLQEKPLFECVNVGTGQGVSVLEVIKTFEEVSGRKLPYTIAPRREGDLEAIYADVQKSKQMLQWEAKRTIREALTHAWAWQQAVSL